MMKYSCKVEIDLPIDQVVKLWEDENNFKKWQDGFESIQHISGIPNQIGAKSKIILNGERYMELEETILSVDLPNEKTAKYEHIHMINTQKSSFKAIDDHRTLYVSEVEYIQFNGFIIKIIAKLFPNKFKEQSQKWMNQFKEFAEKSNSKI